MTVCQWSKYGTCALLPLLLASWKGTPGEDLHVVLHLFKADSWKTGLRGTMIFSWACFLSQMNLIEGRDENLHFWAKVMVLGAFLAKVWAGAWCFLSDWIAEQTVQEIRLISFWFILGEFSLFLGARLTLNCCWVVPKTTESCAGTQVRERYVTTAISTQGLLYIVCFAVCVSFPLSLWSANIIPSSMCYALFLKWMSVVHIQTEIDTSLSRDQRGKKTLTFNLVSTIYDYSCYANTLEFSLSMCFFFLLLE